MRHPTILLSLAAIILVSACDAGKQHNVTVGSRSWGDHLLQREVIKEDWSWLRITKKSITLSGDGVSKITMIKAFDQARDGNGAEAFLVAGGPGQSWVTFTFKSQRSHPIDFIVEIYGK